MSQDTMPQISLRAARTNAKLSLVEASEQLGISKATLSNWENSKSEPRISQLEQMSKLYDMPINFIFVQQKSI